MSRDHDVIIIGAGVVGLTLARLLAPRLSVLLIDRGSMSPPCIDHRERVYALNECACSLLDEIGVWSQLQPHAGVYRDMHVFDVLAKQSLHWSCFDIDRPSLGYVVSDSALKHRLLHHPPQSITQLAETDVETWSADRTGVVCTTSRGTYRGQLLVGADGIHSWIRRHQQVAVQQSHAEQKALVAPVRINTGHRASAWQWFLEHGPLAFLPLADPHEVAMIWSGPSSVITPLADMALPDLTDIIEQHVGADVGAVQCLGPRHIMPLLMQRSERLVGPGWVLVGDAAQTILPLAGQGLNSGLADVATLASVLLPSVQQGLPWSDMTHLNRYARYRHLHHRGLLQGIDGIQRMMTWSHPAWIWLRGLGIQRLQAMPCFKRQTIRWAQGRSALWSHDHGRWGMR